MRLPARVAIAVAVLGAGVGAFVATVASRAATRREPPPPVARWLGLTDEQAKAVEQADPRFATETDALRTDLCEKREALAALLEDPQSPKDRILAQVEQVIAAQDTLTRRVAQHLVAIRPLLTPEQQKQLMGACASGMRCAAPCRFRGGETSGDAAPGGPPCRDGRPGGRRGERGWGPR
ncbi:MAG: periplasmic heavy metal sensor [Planctomycetes bacterium]|nr:periplasmic heavy metal sensor [Planctomycetota bacterium]